VSSWCCADASGCSAKLSVAIDGSKFKAVNARDRNFTQAKMQRRLAQIDEGIARYLSQLDSADRQDEAVPEAKITRLNEKIATLRQEIHCLSGLRTEGSVHNRQRAADLTLGARNHP
jgi:peptidoglycan hydrolase CwlO-like protein